MAICIDARYDILRRELASPNRDDAITVNNSEAEQRRRSATLLARV